MIKNKTCYTYDITIHSNYIDIIHSRSKGVRVAYTYIMSKTFSPNPRYHIHLIYKHKVPNRHIYLKKSNKPSHYTPNDIVITYS